MSRLGQSAWRLAGTLGWLLILLGAGLLASLLASQLLGEPPDWRQWLNEHGGLFLAWRVLLYSGTLWGWLWLRRRLRAREPDGAAAGRLWRAELAAVVAVLLLEASLFVSA